MPVMRNFVGANGPIASATITKVSNGTSVETSGEGQPEGDGEQDDNKRYCFCNGVSYGEMIGCDDMNCEIEWVCGFSNNLVCSLADSWTSIVYSSI